MTFFTSRLRFWLGILFIAIAAAGCSNSATGLRGQSADRAYAEALLPPAGALGADWHEIRRGVILRDGDDASPGSDNFLTAEKDLMRSANVPCRICAGIIYGDAVSQEPEATVTAVYFPEHLYALPLAQHDPLPQGFASNWLLGADGVAMASLAEEGKTGDGSEEQENVSRPSDENGKESANPASVAAPAVVEWGIDLAELLPAESAEDIARLLPQRPAAVYLAAHGLLVRIIPGKNLSHERFAQAIAGIRRHLALRLYREKALREELARRRAAQRGQVVLEAQANPAAGVYWGLLEKAMGVIYSKKY